MAVIAVWLGIQMPFSEVGYFWALLIGFVVAGWLPYDHRRRGKQWRWPRYVYPLADATLLTFTLLAPNPLDAVTYPPPLYLRFGNEIYFFVLIASAVFYYAPRVVIWSGICATLTWGIGTLWIAFLPASRVFSSDTLHQFPSVEDEIAYILTPELVNLFALASQGIVFLLVAGSLALAVSRSRALVFRQAQLERERSNLARHFSPNMVEELSNMDEPLGAARSQSVAILFADIVGFTSLAEPQPPEKVLALLREVLGLMARQVFLHRGTLDKYLGDGIMATFGTPRGTGHEAEDALACARGILADLANLNGARESRGDPNVRLGIGVHYGPVVLGDVGDENRLEFAVVGDTVNVASRFERLTRELGVHLVVSGDLISALGEGTHKLVTDLHHGAPQQVRGREEPLPVWTL
ncbi:MAG: adenylate/guanylate cyclase domain-containing protein [Alphaproteobacteria bacterium]